MTRQTETTNSISGIIEHVLINAGIERVHEKITDHLPDVIKAASTNYYNKTNDDKTWINDQEFDQLIEELRRIDPQHTILFTTGWGAETPDNCYPHWTLIEGIPNKKKYPIYLQP